MAWMAANLYVCCDDAGQVADALAALLAGGEHRTDLEDFSELPDPAVVCPAREGWVVVTSAAAWIDDLAWAAQRLSSACAATAASGEVFGNCYQLRLSVHEEGQQKRELRSPEHEPDEDGPMPLYEDVEQLLFTALRELGVPRELIAAGTRPFRDCPLLAPAAGITLLPMEGEVERSALQVQLPDLAADDAPVLPTRMGQGFGSMIFEDRYVEGVPGESAMARLFELEGAFTERARRACPDGEAEVSTTFTYYSPFHQDSVDAMLHSHDRHTLPVEERVRPPWWAFWRYFGKLK